MAGTRTGAAAIITCHFEQALYLHSASHCLNLVVMTSLQDTLIMGVDRAVEYFGGHIKRQRAMEKAISDTQPQSTKNKLHGLCRTRQVQRLDVPGTNYHPLLHDWISFA